MKDTRSSDHSPADVPEETTESGVLPPDRALNRAMREAVDFIHAEGWDQPPTLFALVPAAIVAEATGQVPFDAPAGSFTLIVQELPETNSIEELQDYIARTAWPQQVEGAILVQEIMFRNSAVPGEGPRPARLFSGVLDGGPDLTLLQLRPTEEELAAAGPFADDKIELLGGPDVAPGVIALLQATFEEVLDPADADGEGNLW